MKHPDLKIAIVGLGYVGLPLAVDFGKHYKTLGFDISSEKIASYQKGCDPMGAIAPEAFRAATHTTFSLDPAQLGDADVLIIGVPTPVNQAHIPDLSPLTAASQTVGTYMKRGAIVVYESTVYPGATEEVCIPLLERHSGMTWRQNFNVGYSPERINPGDRVHTLSNTVKIVSGDTAATLETLADLYGTIVMAAICRVSSIKVAEAAKVVENIQRDINIALMNELAIVFDKIGIDTLDVLEAAGTKWNFLPFRPGLVGGHCIGVDPYYMTHKAEMLGYHPQVILAGRRINDGMASFIAKTTVQQMIAQGGYKAGDRVIVLGLTFKENCPDLRNSQVTGLIAHLKKFSVDVVIHDPIADPADARREYGIELTAWDALPKNASAIIAAVSHQQYLDQPLANLLAHLKPAGVFIDVKSAYDPERIKAAGYAVWRL